MTDFEKVWNFENLYRAYRKARRGKRWKGAAAKFEVNLLEALHLLSVQLRAKTYRLSPYNTFKVYEPKERIVMSNSYKDKVVQHALCDNVLGPRVLPSFIKDNYASQEGKGTHFGLERLEEFMRRFYRKKGVDGWVLKGDIRKYFYSIRHDVLKELVRKYVDDPECLWLLDMIIDSTEGNVGIPIGNQSSQLFALLYLSPLDHFIKEKLGVKFYGRYMDDFYLIHEDKEYLRYCWKEIERRVNEIGLSLNEKTAIYPLKNGIDFFRLPYIFDGNGRGDPQGAPEVKEQRPPQGEEIVRADGGREDRAGHREAIIPELAWPRGEGELLSLDPQHGSAFQQILQQGRRRAERA